MVIAAIRLALQIIEPMAFPYEIPEFPSSAACEDTMTSGSVVPIETTVAPIKSSGR